MSMQLVSPFDTVVPTLDFCTDVNFMLQPIKFVDTQDVEHTDLTDQSFFPTTLTNTWIELEDDHINFNPSTVTTDGTYHMQLKFRFQDIYESKQDEPVTKLQFAAKDMRFQTYPPPSAYLVLVGSST